jgi:hypothetical protein
MALSIDDLIDVWRKSFDSSYTVPLETENDGVGLDVISGMAAIFARVSASIETSTQAFYIRTHSIQVADPASGEVRSTGAILITRGMPADGDVELEDGDELVVEIKDTVGDFDKEIGLELAADQTLLSGSTVPVSVSVRAERAGYQGNVPDTSGRRVVFRRSVTMTINGATVAVNNRITDTGTGDRFDAGMIGQFVTFREGGTNYPTVPRRIISVDVGASTTTITVDGAVLTGGTDNITVVDVNELPVDAELDGDLSGGKHGWLDTIGEEREVGRNVGEADPSYRSRVEALPDTVSPNALYRAVSRVLTPLSVPFRLFESRGPEIVGAAWDASPWDDTAADVGLLGRHHFAQGDRFEYQGFYVVVERQYYGDPGGAWDYAPPTAGVHPSSAWGWVPWGGAAFGFYEDLRSMAKEVEAARAAGVPWLIVIVEEI